MRRHLEHSAPFAGQSEPNPSLADLPGTSPCLETLASICVSRQGLPFRPLSSNVSSQGPFAHAGARLMPLPFDSSSAFRLVS